MHCGVHVPQFLNETFSDIIDLKQKLSNAIAIIDETMLQRTWQEIEYCLDLLRLTNGALIEMYYMRKKILCCTD